MARALPCKIRAVCSRGVPDRLSLQCRNEPSHNHRAFPSPEQIRPAKDKPIPSEDARVVVCRLSRLSFGVTSRLQAGDVMFEDVPGRLTAALRAARADFPHEKIYVMAAGL